MILDDRQSNPPTSFVDWLRKLCRRPSDAERADSTLDLSCKFFDTVYNPDDWRPDQPWFKVPTGQGGLNSFKEKVNGGLLRRIEKETEGKPLFAVSGIPGTVGSATRNIWRSLLPFLATDCDFAIWPFEGELSSLLSKHSIVLAETYPGLAYAVALAEKLPTNRIKIAKTKLSCREYACELLKNMAWINANNIELGDLGPVRSNEDNFDAHLTAAAVLRCILEDIPLTAPNWVDAEVEGSMLLAGPVCPTLKAKTLKRGDTTQHAGHRIGVGPI